MGSIELRLPTVTNACGRHIWEIFPAISYSAIYEPRRSRKGKKFLEARSWVKFADPETPEPCGERPLRSPGGGFRIVVSHSRACTKLLSRRNCFSSWGLFRLQIKSSFMATE